MLDINIDKLREGIWDYLPMHWHDWLIDGG
jgi:hypothetical protein